MWKTEANTLFGRLKPRRHLRGISEEPNGRGGGLVKGINQRTLSSKKCSEFMSWLRNCQIPKGSAQ